MCDLVLVIYLDKLVFYWAGKQV